MYYKNSRHLKPVTDFRAGIGSPMTFQHRGLETPYKVHKTKNLLGRPLAQTKSAIEGSRWVGNMRYRKKFVLLKVFFCRLCLWGHMYKYNTHPFRLQVFASFGNVANRFPTKGAPKKTQKHQQNGLFVRHLGERLAVGQCNHLIPKNGACGCG